MGLHQVIETIRAFEKELAVFNLDPSDSIPADLATYFETQNVRVTTHRTSSGAPTVAVLSNGGEVLEVVSTDLLRAFVERSSSHSEGVGVSDGAYRPILRHLKETTFTAYDTEQMLYASREIEDRARRTGNGTIHAGFQRCSVLDDQRAIYADLDRRGVDVHVYGVPDAAPPDIGGGRIHAVETDEIAATWFVVFDGGGNESRKCALLAEERTGDTFYGAWTYDAGIVDAVVDYLGRTYRIDDAHTRTGL